MSTACSHSVICCVKYHTCYLSILLTGCTCQLITGQWASVSVNIVYIQIFEGCNFRGLPKSRISMILFSWISCYHTLYFKCITTVL